MNSDFLLCCFIVLFCFVASAFFEKPLNVTKRGTGPRIRQLKCVDRNLQRTLVWNSKNSTRQFQIKELKVQFCVTTNCHYRGLRCYKDDNRTVRIRNITESTCKTAVEQLLPYNHLTFKVRAIYRVRDGSNRTVVSEAKTTCGPIESAMTLSAPTLVFTLKTTSIKVQSVLPMELTNAIARCNDYDLDIRFYFCLHQDGEECEARVEKCNAFYTFLPLEPGTEYVVESWYRSRSAGDVDSARRSTIAATLPDPFPVQYQIITVIGLSTLLIAVVVTIVVARLVRKMWKNWYKYIHDELPGYLEETKEELKSWNSGKEDFWDLQRRKFVDDQFTIPPIRPKGKREISDPRTDDSAEDESSESGLTCEATRKNLNDVLDLCPTTGTVAASNSKLSPPPYVTQLGAVCFSDGSENDSDFFTHKTSSFRYREKTETQSAGKMVGTEMNHEMDASTSRIRNFNPRVSASLSTSDYDRKK